MESLIDLVSFGNSKLPKNTMIFNMSPAHLCPSRKKKMCAIADWCYALRAEVSYPGCYPYRIRQMDYWINVTAEQMLKEIKAIIKVKRNPVKQIRFNESGDFHTQECVDKLIYIANHMNIPVYVYTKRYDLDFSKAGKLIVIGSTDKFIGKEGIDKTFIAIDKDLFDQKSKKEQCLMDCGKCGKCHNRRFNIIYVPFHGTQLKKYVHSDRYKKLAHIG